MRKLIYTLPPSLFDVFVIEFNGYGIEVLSRDENEVVFSIYAQDEEAEEIKNAINEIFEELGGGELVLEEKIKDENWEEKWKENFKPVEIPPFIIIPEWEIYRGDLIPIKLKIGMAFGTGIHPTTQIMLELLPSYIGEGDTVLDVGTGTGILAVASAKLGGKVTAIDIQDEAVKECKDNAWENEVEIDCIKASVEQINNKYSVVVANLQIDIFRKYFQHLTQIFDRYLIVSGIYGEKEREELLKMVEKAGISVLEERSKKDLEERGERWYGFVFKG